MKLPALVTALVISVGLTGTAHAASPPAIEAAHGMVVSSQLLASEAGDAILRAGGNAVDAAVAVGYAEAVVNPCCGNIGGGGFLVAHLADGRDVFLNFRETAPAAATAGMYLDASGDPVKDASLIGWKSAGVPGTVLGLDTALREWGSLPRAQVMAPAIALARNGFVVTRGDTDILDARTAAFQHDPALAVFLRPDGAPLQPGERLTQPDLARTLQRIADEGPDAFYRDVIPQAIEAASRAGGGILTAADFAAYRVTTAAPLTCAYRGHTVLSAPPPSSGGVTVCEILRVLEGYDLHALGWHSADAVHVMTEASRHAYFDRNTFLGDPAFIQNPLDWMISDAHADAIRSAILPGRATSSATLLPGTAPHERPETTHYSVLDAAGNAVSVTYTINGLFGALVMAPGAGFLLNDEMDDFTIKPGVPNMFGLVQGTANAIAPGKRPLSSMAPTIILRDGHTAYVLGSPGGSRIITAVLETALNLIDHGMAPQEAVDAPRVHHQWLPDVIFAEPRALSPDTARMLGDMGYKITEQTPWSAVELIAAGQAAAAGPASAGNDSARSGGMRPGLLYGANDDRRPAGAAVGH